MNETTPSWLLSRRFWTDTLERAIRTAAQAALAVVSVPAAADVADVPLSLPWEAMAYAVLAATLLSVLTSLAGRGVGDPSTASLTSGTAGPSMAVQPYEGETVKRYNLEG